MLRIHYHYQDFITKQIAMYVFAKLHIICVQLIPSQLFVYVQFV